MSPSTQRPAQPMPPKSAPSRKAVAREVASRAPKTSPALMTNGQPAKISDYFGINTFGVRQMRDKLPRDAYEKIMASVRQGKKLDIEIAGRVASVIREWAV